MSEGQHLEQQGVPEVATSQGLLSPANRIYAAWIIALVATLGSLYFSEIKGFRPCPLCWFQRIFMYPLVIVLGIAAWQNDLRVRQYVIPLAVIGALIALYQNLETWGVVPVLKACTIDASASCGTPWPIWGTTAFADQFNTTLTIPVLSMTAFALIIWLMLWPTRKK